MAKHITVDGNEAAASSLVRFSDGTAVSIVRRADKSSLAPINS